MDYRKLISFGKSSYVISLPKNWIRQNKLNKGDLIAVEEKDTVLILRSRAEEQEEVRKKTINVDGKSVQLITREINSAYIENYREITLKGVELKVKSKELLQKIRELIALEVLEFDSQHIVTKDFLSMETVSTLELIKKMDMIVRSMLKDCCKQVTVEEAENIQLRDKDVNRLSFLIYRAVRDGLRNPSRVLKKFGLNPIDLLNHYWITYHLEVIADEAKRVSRVIPEHQLKGLTPLMQKIEAFYLDVVKACYKADRTGALEISGSKDDLVQAINRSYKALTKPTAEANYAYDRLRRMVGAVHEVNRLTFQH